MKIKLQYYKQNEQGEYEPIKEGTEVATKKEAKEIINILFKVFSLKPEAIIEINDDRFSWNNFENKIVEHRTPEEINFVTLSEAKN